MFSQASPISSPLPASIQTASCSAVPLAAGSSQVRCSTRTTTCSPLAAVYRQANDSDANLCLQTSTWNLQSNKTQNEDVLVVKISEWHQHVNYSLAILASLKCWQLLIILYWKYKVNITSSVISFKLTEQSRANAHTVSGTQQTWLGEKVPGARGCCPGAEQIELHRVKRLILATAVGTPAASVFLKMWNCFGFAR